MPRKVFVGNEKKFFVYIVASAARVLYVGFTSDLNGRVLEHKQGRFEGFTSHFHNCRLVYLESFDDPNFAIAREKQIKRWRREKKIWLIESVNPDWHDLSDGWYDTKESNAWPLDSGLKPFARGDIHSVIKGRGPIAEKRERNWQKKIAKLKLKAME